MISIPVLLLTTFISVNGAVVEVPENSPEAVSYMTETETDIGSEEYLESVDTTISSGDATGATSGNTVVNIQQDNTEVVALLEDSIELLSENSSTVTGTINTTVLDLMDRMIDEYPSYYKYAGFRTSTDDSYSTTLYIAKKAESSGSTITFSEDCIAINFERYQQTGYSSYIYYTITDTPNASVDVNSQSIVYTNVLEGYPSLGNKSQLPAEYIWIGIFVILAIIIFTRRNSNA